MYNLNNSFEAIFVKSLRKWGIILPEDESDMEYYKKEFKKDNIPPIPDGLSDPKAILQRGYIFKQYPTDVDREMTGNMARAAREGTAIPEEILVKMKKDREKAKNDDE